MCDTGLPGSSADSARSIANSRWRWNSASMSSSTSWNSKPETFGMFGVEPSGVKPRIFFERYASSSASPLVM